MTYLFDFDGTLVDSMPRWIRKMLRILDEYGIAYGDDIIRIITPLGDLGCARYFQKLGVPLSVEELFLMMDEYAIPAYRDEIPAKETVPETLRALRAAGHRLAVLTASPHKMLDPCLGRLGLFDLFDAVWSSDDFGMGKSDPEIYRLAAARLGVEVGEVTFLDDNIIALKTAKEAGMIPVGVYDPSSAEDEAQIRALAARYLVRMEELLDA